jgi:hypothetical protein
VQLQGGRDLLLILPNPLLSSIRGRLLLRLSYELYLFHSDMHRPHSFTIRGPTVGDDPPARTNLCTGLPTPHYLLGNLWTKHGLAHPLATPVDTCHSPMTAEIPLWLRKVGVRLPDHLCRCSHCPLPRTMSSPSLSFSSLCSSSNLFVCGPTISRRTPYPLPRRICTSGFPEDILSTPSERQIRSFTECWIYSSSHSRHFLVHKTIGSLRRTTFISSARWS